MNVESIKKDLPILSKTLEPHTTPLGAPAKRPISTYFLPYDIKKEVPFWETPLTGRRTELQMNALRNDLKKRLKEKIRSKIIVSP